MAKSNYILFAAMLMCGALSGYAASIENAVTVPASASPQSNAKAAKQQTTITGLVTDESGEPLPGVTIRPNGKGNGAVTDADGKYSITVSSGTSSLIFSYVGMQQTTEKINGRKVINTVMKQDAQSLDDVVVVGAYGTAQKRIDQVGSAFQVNADDLKGLPNARIDVMLDGLVPGVKIDPNTDSPDSSRLRYNVRVRGEASLSASNEPLWVVDGTPIYTGEHTNQIPGMNTSVSPLSYIASEDIESITVLKDASATSIYGADGGNGVILITTKKGRESKLSTSVSVQYGISTIDKSTSPKVLNGQQYLTLAREAWANAGNNPALFPYSDNQMNHYSVTDTNWRDVFYDTGNTLQANLSLRGGTQNTKYYVSGSYYLNNGTVKGNKQQRFSIRSNNDFTFLKKLTASVRLMASYNENDLFNMGKDFYQFLPIYSPYNDDGTPRLYNTYINGTNDDGTPKWVTGRFLNSVPERDENIYNQKTWYVNANFVLRYDIIPGLSYTGQFGVDYSSGREEQYDAGSNWTGMTTTEGAVGYSSRMSLDMTNWTTVHRINFNRTFGEMHDVGAVLGFEAGSKDYITIGATGSGFINDHVQDVSYANERKGSNSSKTTRKASLLAQASYAFDHRYYLVLNGRRDGNSQFGSDVRWANFGSVGVSWNIQNEKFWQLPWWDVFKLKFSYGVNGNSRLGSQQALGLYSFGDSYSYDGINGGVQSGCPNRKLSWETTYMTNYSIRLRFLHRFDIEVEGYHNITKNLLSNLDVSRTTGDTRVYRNVGEILNRGIEVSITSENFVPKRPGDFGWITVLNISHNRNKLLKLYNGIQKNMGTTSTWKEGYDTNTWFLVRWAGVDPRDGMPLWYDINGNVTRTYSYDNRVPYKNPSPDVSGGFINTFQYKGVSLRVSLNYTFGGWGFTTFGRNAFSDGYDIQTENQAIDQLDHWRKPGDLSLNPVPLWNKSTSSVMNSTRYLYKKTNIRLQNVMLAYEFPKSLIKHARMTNANVAFIGDNLWVWTPGLGQKNKNAYRNLMSGFPLERMFSLQLTVGF